MKTLTMHARGNDTVELLLYDTIGEDAFFGGISARDFRAQVKSIRSGTLNLRINSPGGSVFEASAMMAALDEFPGRIEVDIDGIAASAASVVAMAGDKIRMAAGSMMMIHDPHTVVMGGADEMRKTADILDASKGQLLAAYARHSKAGKEQIAKWMADETWFLPEDAVRAGLAHECSGPVQIAACAWGKSVLARMKYRRAPKTLAALAAMASGNPLSLAVGDAVQWLSEDPEEMCAELEDGVIEEISDGTLTIPGTSLSLAGSADDLAVRILDEDEDEKCWYLKRASELTKVAPPEVIVVPAPATMPMMSAEDAWIETRRRAELIARLGLEG